MLLTIISSIARKRTSLLLCKMWQVKVRANATINALTSNRFRLPYFQTQQHYRFQNKNPLMLVHKLLKVG
jgi:hypothetical protein